jgi:Protein of unknown function (DUF2846)
MSKLAPILVAIFVATALALAGCASSGPLGSAALSAGPAPSTGRLVIYRTAIVGMALQPEYTLNGKTIGVSQSQGFVMCDLKPGKYEVTTPNPDINVNLGGGSNKVSVDLRAGATSYVEASASMGLIVGVITLANASDERGRSETQSLHLTQSSCPAV